MRQHRGVLVVLLVLLAQILVLPAASAATVHEVEAVDFAFEPDALQIAPGDELHVTNTGIAPHTLTDADGAFSFNLYPGEDVTVALPEEGTRILFCKFHGAPDGSGMAMTVQVGAPAPPAHARLEATDTVTSAIAWSQLTFEDGAAPYVLLGRDDLFADSLASGGGQGAIDAPLLLTGSGQLDPRTTAELERLGARTVYVLGGPAAIAEAVVEQLEAAGYGVVRIFGGSRIDTAVAVAERFFPTARSAVLARAYAADEPTQAFADSLAAGAFAAARRLPVLLSDTAGLSAPTRDYLAARAIDTVYVIGGSAALSEQVATDLEALGIEVIRLAGPNRLGTAGQIAGEFLSSGEPTAVSLVDAGAADAWADGFAAAAGGNPVLLTSGGELPDESVAVLLPFFFERIVCGTTVVAAACDRAEVVESAAVDLPLPFTPTGILSGAAEVPGPGADDASGAAVFSPTSSPDALCYNYFTMGLDEDPVTAAHIHEGAAGAAGPIVVGLTIQPGPFGPSDVYGCAFGLDTALVGDILANPGDYYANLHTAGFPDGAVRGQLFSPNALLLGDLTGETILGGDGDQALVGFTIQLGTPDPGQLCGFVAAFALDEQPRDFTGTAIHEGGPTVETTTALVALQELPDGPFAFSHVQCVDGDPADIDAIKADPFGHYGLVSTAARPDGAVRGQLLNLYEAFFASAAPSGSSARSRVASGATAAARDAGVSALSPYRAATAARR